MALDFQPDEHSQAEAGPLPAYLRAIAVNNAVASSAFTRRRQAEGDSEIASARSTFAIRPSCWSR